MVYNRTSLIMKKIFFTSLMVLLVLFSFTACKKDGVYTPQKKISKIYIQMPGHQKELQSKWIWDGKMLAAVEYYDNNNVSSTATYTYKGKQLEKIESENGFSMVFIYQKSKLVNLKMYYANILAEEGVVTHTKNKITQIDYTYYNQTMKSENIADFIQSLRSLTGIFLENSVENMIDFHEKMAKNETKALATWSVFYTYIGNNVLEEKYVTANEEDLYIYQYDKKRNPFYGLLMGGDSDLPFEFSKNNIVNVERKTEGNVQSATNFEYEYDKNYPIEKRVYDAKTNVLERTMFYEYIK